MKSNQGSALVIALLVIMSLSILAAGFAMVTNTETSISGMQKSETKAFYIAQTAIDRSVKELVGNPGWRDGFTAVGFDGGKYDVEIFDSTDNGIGTYDPNLPDNYVKVLATGNLNGVRKQIEALWVNPVTAFNYAYSAGDKIELHNHGTPSAVVTADIHNNSWNGGVIQLNEGTTVYGNVTSVGDIVVGTPKDGSAAVVYGNVWGADISITNNSMVLKYLNLSEPVEGRDLNGDSDALDIGLTKGLADVQGATGVSTPGSPAERFPSQSVGQPRLPSSIRVRISESTTSWSPVRWRIPPGRTTSSHRSTVMATVTISTRRPRLPPGSQLRERTS
jgi:hypothetical protein